MLPQGAAAALSDQVPDSRPERLLDLWTDFLRQYHASELGNDGYPYSWHKIELAARNPRTRLSFGIKDVVRVAAGCRCVRCGHPYRNGEHGNGEWSPCDERCTHENAFPTSLNLALSGVWDDSFSTARYASRDGVEARWRILTVHHASGVKSDCRWWNLLALCQRCHLTVQGRVVLERAFIFEHSAWFKPYAAGWYAWKYLGEEIGREEADRRQDELLGLERLA